MKKKSFAAMAAILILAAAVLLSGCESSFRIRGSSDGSAANESAAASSAGTVPESAPAASESASSSSSSSKSSSASASSSSSSSKSSSASAGTESDVFTARDLTQTADLSDGRTLTVSDGETVKITEAGVYVLTGSAKEACVVVDAGDDDKVQLVLSGLSVVNTDQPCILVENADKVFLTSAEGSENVLTVTGAFSGDEDAAVFSRDDLVLNGLGTVTVSSSKDGIRSNDDLKLTGGTWVVTSAKCALKAHEGIYAADGTYTLTAGSDGLHAENNDDDTVGCIEIDGGVFTIKAGDDGIHGTTCVTVNGGTLTITAAEGIEATQVTVNGGKITISASDDGINAARKSTSMTPKIEINGGEITISMGAGDTDGIDSNGDLIITGGTINVTAQSPFDYDGTCTHTGGTLIVNGTETNTVTNQMMGGGMGGMGGPGGMGNPPGGFGERR